MHHPLTHLAVLTHQRAWGERRANWYAGREFLMITSPGGLCSIRLRLQPLSAGSGSGSRTKVGPPEVSYPSRCSPSYCKSSLHKYGLAEILLKDNTSTWLSHAFVFAVVCALASASAATIHSICTLSIWPGSRVPHRSFFCGPYCLSTVSVVLFLLLWLHGWGMLHECRCVCHFPSQRS